TYTGRGWYQSEHTRRTTWSLDPPQGQVPLFSGEINKSEISEAGIRSDPNLYRDELRQTFHLYANLPGILFTAYQPVQLNLPIPAVVVDDSFTIQAPPSADSMVSGQHYQVRSLKFFAQSDLLRRHDYSLNKLAEEEPEFYERYTQLPERGTMENPNAGFDFTRVRAKTYEVTAGAKTVYGKVDAIVAFLRNNYKYSLNPPSAVPSEMDAMEYFLLEWEPKRGHCENFSTALAVMCRTIGIPSRVVTGYSPGSYNILRNRYVVQERNAHAWTEIYWPEIGWVEFDATPMSWYQGLGERAAGSWISFHNAMENLYIYDPRGYIRDKIVPVFERSWASAGYFINQRELAFYEFADPIYRYNAENPSTVIGILGVGTLFLVMSLIFRHKLDRDYNRREALRRGRKCLLQVKRQLERKGVPEESIATEMDCALEASNYSPSWGKSVGELALFYQAAKYSQKGVKRSDLIGIIRACKAVRQTARV
ncbi:MAG TPA: transglutaminase domain-containing protein, partial [Firmicutes bacterium]|nr:transglutaminase domain-containing protein [Bacillota bacterium]